MAFYFALLNVSKQKENNQEKSSHHHRRHRRHSIASVESPLLDYRLLPRPQLLSDDIVITNDLAHHVEDHPSTSHAPLSRRCRGSARASKWVNDNHSHHQLSTSRSHTRALEPVPAAPLSRSKRMAFGGGGGERGRGRRGQSEEDGSGERRKRSREGQEPDTRGTSTSTSEGRQPKPTKPKPIRNRQKSQSHSEDDLEEKQQKLGKRKEEGGKKGMKREGRGRGKGMEEVVKRGGGRVGAGAGAMEKRAGNLESKKDQLKPKIEANIPIPPSKPAVPVVPSSVQGTSSSRIPVSTTPTSKTIQTALQSSFPLTISISSSSSRHFSPPAPVPQQIQHSVSSNGLKPSAKLVFRSGMGEDRPLNPSIFQMMAGSATDESGRSSSQMSNESTTPRRDDSPASSCDSKEREVTMKLSGISMSSRSSEPRLKKVTFESSPYVISNSFLGGGAGSGVLVVRRNSGTAVRRMPWASSRLRDEVSGGDWWTPCEEVMREEQEEEANNQMNRQIEKSQGTRSILRRGLIRRRSTSDKSRLLAYRNTGFLSSSQERKSESTSTSRMTVSVDRAQYK